jgi:hypothetical protein
MTEPSADTLAHRRLRLLRREVMRNLALGCRPTECQRNAVARVVQTRAIAESVREKVLRGEATVRLLDMSERAVQRAEKDLQRHIPKRAPKPRYLFEDQDEATA